MNKNRLILIFSALFLMTLNIAQAQRGGKMLRGLEITEELKTALSLTDAQVTQLEALQLKAREQFEAIRGHENADRDTQRDHARASHKEMRGEVEEILSPEQMEQLKAHLREKAEERRALREQIDKEGMRAEIKAYREANVKPVMEAQYAQLAEVLSEEDKAQLATWRAAVKVAREKLQAERAANPPREENTEPKAGIKGDRRRQHKRGRALDQLPEVKADLEMMVAKYDTQLTALLEEVAPQAEQWKTDIKAIRDKYIPEELRKDRPKHGQGEAQEEKRMLGRKMRFLLKGGK